MSLTPTPSFFRSAFEEGVEGRSDSIPTSSLVHNQPGLCSRIGRIAQRQVVDVHGITQLHVLVDTSVSMF